MGNVAAIGLVFLLLVLVWVLVYLSAKIGLVVDAISLWLWFLGNCRCHFCFLLLNIEHAKGTTPMSVHEYIKVLDELNKASDPDDQGLGGTMDPDVGFMETRGLYFPGSSNF